MSEALTWTKSEGLLTIAIEGGFTSNLAQQFRDAYKNVEKKDRAIVIDLALAESIDSAALGFLIQMKKEFEESHIKVISIINSNAQIRKVFETMRFSTMFHIDKAQPS